MTDITQILQTS